MRKLFLTFAVLLTIFEISNENMEKVHKNMPRNTQTTPIVTSEIDTRFGKCVIRNCWNTICAASPQGDCKNYSCMCNEGFYTFPASSMARCCYEQKSQLTTFILEIIIGFGLGHFYALNYSMGMTKLVIYSVICFLFYSTLVYRHLKNEKIGEENSIILKFTNILSVLLCFCTYTIWQCIDILLIGTNYYVDGNGAPLKRW